MSCNSQGLCWTLYASVLLQQQPAKSELYEIGASTIFNSALIVHGNTPNICVTEQSRSKHVRSGEWHPLRQHHERGPDRLLGHSVPLSRPPVDNVYLPQQTGSTRHRPSSSQMRHPFSSSSPKHRNSSWSWCCPAASFSAPTESSHTQPTV